MISTQLIYKIIWKSLLKFVFCTNLIPKCYFENVFIKQREELEFVIYLKKTLLRPNVKLKYKYDQNLNFNE